MRCVCCDKLLSNREAVRKGANTGEYLDMCDGCYSTIADSVAVVDGVGLDDDTEEDFDFEDTEDGESDGTWESR